MPHFICTENGLQPLKVENPNNLEWGTILTRKNSKIISAAFFSNHYTRRNLLIAANLQVLNRTDRGNRYQVELIYGKKPYEVWDDLLEQLLI